MKMPCFTSVFADSMGRFVAFRQSCGCIYRQSAYELACFDRFASASDLKSPLITAGLARDFLAGMSEAVQKTRYNRMCVLRSFSAFHHLQWPESEVLHELGVRAEERIRFIVLDKEEVAALLRNVDMLDGMTCGVLSMACIIGLLYCCGLRIGEALALSVEDFDAELSTLFIQRGKFGKQRIVPLSPSSRDAVATYLSSRRLPAVVDAQGPLFVDRLNRPMTYKCFYPAFKRLVRDTGLRQRRGPVRPHDLRHSFATTVLRRAMEGNGDVNTVLPRLATFMGHVSFNHTQIYLHTDPACLAQASASFRNSFTSNSMIQEVSS